MTNEYGEGTRCGHIKWTTPKQSETGCSDKFVFPQDREALVVTISSPLESAIERGLVDAAGAIELLEVRLIFDGRADADSLPASRSKSEG